MKKFNCIFCKFEVKKDYNLIKHYKKKHNIVFSFNTFMNLKDFIKNFTEYKRRDAQLMHVNILNYLHSNVRVLNLGYGTLNINHDLHEILFHLIYQLYIKKIHKIENFKIIVDDRMEKWSIYLLKIVCNDLNLKLEIENNNKLSYHDCIKYNIPHRRLLRCLYFYNKYLNIFEYIRVTTINYLKLKISNKKRVLYTRKDMKSRRLFRFEKIYKYFDLIIDNLKDLSVEEQIKLFYNTSHLVCPNGACTANIIYMNNDAKILDIQTKGNNSWPIKYGSSKIIKKYSLYVSKNIKKSSIVNSELNHLRNFNQDYDIYLDDDLEKKIKNFLVD